MRDKWLFVKGVFILAAIPILTALIPAIFLYILPSFGILLLDRTVVMVVVLYPIIFYAYWVLQRVTYSDLDVLDKVTIPEAPENVVKLLKTTTRGTNRLVNVEIIYALTKRNLAQSRLAEQVQAKGINLTDTRIIEYLHELESCNIIESQKAYKREYSLTDAGKWCHQAAKVCFPGRQFWFIVRYYLGHKKLPPYLGRENKEK
ncbi:hypothetical protein MUO69_04940 [Candidatus Bathyarchaeota archaeon]|nr:hypothetical protein [Candidatus Bathyarchaeota archaeon]